MKKDPKRERKALLPMTALLGMQSTAEIRNRNSRRQGSKPKKPCSQCSIEHARTVSTENHTRKQCKTTILAVRVLVECSQQTLKINFRGDRWETSEEIVEISSMDDEIVHRSWEISPRLEIKRSHMLPPAMTYLLMTPRLEFEDGLDDEIP